MEEKKNCQRGRQTSGDKDWFVWKTQKSNLKENWIEFNWMWLAVESGGFIWRVHLCWTLLDYNEGFGLSLACNWSKALGSVNSRILSLHWLNSLSQTPPLTSPPPPPPPVSPSNRLPLPPSSFASLRGVFFPERENAVELQSGLYFIAVLYFAIAFAVLFCFLYFYALFVLFLPPLPPLLLLLLLLLLRCALLIKHVTSHGHASPDRITIQHNQWENHQN